MATVVAHAHGVVKRRRAHVLEGTWEHTRPASQRQASVDPHAPLGGPGSQIPADLRGTFL